MRKIVANMIFASFVFVLDAISTMLSTDTINARPFRYRKVLWLESRGTKSTLKRTKAVSRRGSVIEISHTVLTPRLIHRNRHKS